VRPSGIQRDRESLHSLLSGLYQLELAALGNPEYLAAHSERSSILRQIAAFERYSPLVLDSIQAVGTTRILDWGCHHAPDSCLLRRRFGGSVELHGCDFFCRTAFANFHGFASLDYRRLLDPVHLPYDSHSFDLVVASGVLEHAAMDLESIKELHRILREKGKLIITFLPNRLSYTEFIARRRGLSCHRRLYGMSEATRMLRHHGFHPTFRTYDQFLPAHRLQRTLGCLWPLNALLERIWPLRLFCANITIVAERCTVM
jgi:SAM-dependent methyltransferase